jgi:hypothetical protein
VILALRPSTLVVDGNPRAYSSVDTWLSSCWNVADGVTHCANRVDVLSAYVIVTTLLAMVGTLFVALVASKGRERQHSLRATVIVSVAVVVMNTVFSGLRTGLSWFSGYLSQIPGLDAQCRETRYNMCLAETEARRSLLPYHHGVDWPTYDIVPVAMMWLAVLVGLFFVARKLCRVVAAHLADRAVGEEKFETRVVRAANTQAKVSALPGSARGPLIGLVVALAVLAGVAMWIATSHQTANSLTQWADLLAVHAAALLIPLLVLGTLLFQPLRTAVSTVGDVIGYWPRRYAALSGTSYTNEVCGSIEREIDGTKDPLVLVGHSQGSVLCYTTLMRLSTPDDEPDGELAALPDHVSLVTCGSPLQSLYAGFFPRYFRDGDFGALRSTLVDRWFNCWRPTDPIASAFLPDGNIEVPPRLDYRGKLTKHSSYWSEPEQSEVVERLLSGGPADG